MALHDSQQQISTVPLCFYEQLSTCCVEGLDSVENSDKDKNLIDFSLYTCMIDAGTVK